MCCTFSLCVRYWFMTFIYASLQNKCVQLLFYRQAATIIPVSLSLSPVPSDSVRNLTAQIFSSTAIIVSWDPPLEPNGRPYYLLTLQEAGIPLNLSNQGAPAVNKTIQHATTDNVFLFTKLRKYFPYVFTVTPATGAGPAYNHTRIMFLRTDDDSEFIHTGTREDGLCFLLKDVCVSFQFQVLLHCWCPPGICHHLPSRWRGSALSRPTGK